MLAACGRCPHSRPLPALAGDPPLPVPVHLDPARLADLFVVSSVVHYAIYTTATTVDVRAVSE
jgi:hypothetical protein